ncbi:DUF1850 domain-containing protein [Pseudalkalibacillus hwajinpoensis]|uniref:DUF1850 domain-containing protein n=1 Tax=Guptibacillus hwajinpoensis TaxID=208199 RepID=UPI001CD2DB0C|nr:DUF1850 domain-containing protein [Pseudalkalibacillus hwajinpoensis]MCA0992239.1 DUF1850 domain-containing protein [Pseudalkalibacillus hwajinpoensis]
MNNEKRGHRSGALVFRSIVLIIILLCIVLLLIPFQVLTIEEEDGEESAHIGASEFSLRWKHSVEKEDWEEFFVLTDTGILLTKTRFKTFGAGVPNDVGSDTFIKDGWVYMSGIQRSIGTSFYFRTGKTTEHRITVDGQSVKLKANSSYHVTVNQLKLFQALLLKIRVM